MTTPTPYDKPSRQDHRRKRNWKRKNPGAALQHLDQGRDHADGDDHHRAELGDHAQFRFLEVAPQAIDIGLQALDVGFRGQRRVHGFGEHLAMHVDHRFGERRRCAGRLEALDDLVGIEGDRAHAPIVAAAPCQAMARRGVPYRLRLTPSTAARHDRRTAAPTAGGFDSPNDQGGCSATLADFFRPIRIAAPDQWRAVWGSRKARRFLGPGLSTLHAPAPRLTAGSGVQTADQGTAAMRTIASGTHARTLIPRFTLYRTLRRLMGPVLAWRIAFDGRA